MQTLEIDIFVVVKLKNKYSEVHCEEIECM